MEHLAANPIAAETIFASALLCYSPVSDYSLLRDTMGKSVQQWLETIDCGGAATPPSDVSLV